MPTKSPQLADPQVALSSYLSDLLLEPSDSLSDIIDDPIPPEQLIVASNVINNENWRERDFQALLFDVQGLKFAIPLHELNGILTWPDTPLAKTADKPQWHLGLYQQAKQQTEIIDTSHIVLPDSHQDKNDKPHFIISIDDGNWGLTCNKVESVVTLSPEQVSWRQQAGQRPWLAGIVKEKRYSVLNIEALIKLF